MRMYPSSGEDLKSSFLFLSFPLLFALTERRRGVRRYVRELAASIACAGYLTMLVMLLVVVLLVDH